MFVQFTRQAVNRACSLSQRISGVVYPSVTIMPQKQQFIAVAEKIFILRKRQNSYITLLLMSSSSAFFCRFKLRYRGPMTMCSTEWPSSYAYLLFLQLSVHNNLIFLLPILFQPMQ